MIEQAMVFALGFLTAGLLALACLPAVWRRAIRLTSLRLTRLVPLSLEEVQAERDGLRAGFAVERRRLEQRIEAVEARRAETLLTLGRRDADVAALEDAAVLDAAGIAALRGEVDEVTRELREVRAGTGSAAVALHDLTGLAERRLDEVLAMEEKAAALRSTVDEQRATIAALETRLLGLESRRADLERTLADLRTELARAVQAALRAGGERDAVAEEVLRLRTLAEEAEGRAALEARAAGALGGALDDLKLHAAALEAQLAMRAEAALGLTEQLRAARAEGAALREEAAKARAGEVDLAVLRETLKQVADDVLRLTEREPEPRAAQAP